MSEKWNRPKNKNLLYTTFCFQSSKKLIRKDYFGLIRIYFMSHCAHCGAKRRLQLGGREAAPGLLVKIIRALMSSKNETAYHKGRCINALCTAWNWCWCCDSSERFSKYFSFVVYYISLSSSNSKFTSSFLQYSEKGLQLIGGGNHSVSLYRMPKGLTKIL